MIKKLHLLTVISTTCLTVFGEQVSELPIGTKLASSSVRLGVSLTKVIPSTGSSKLPKGVGFLVTEVEEKGPACMGGVTESDLIWKLDDQLLVNKGQLMALLGLSKPGEIVRLSILRNEEEVNLEVKLGNGEVERSTIDLMAVRSFSNVAEGMERRVDLSLKRAFYSNEEGSVEVRRVRGGDAVKIIGADGSIVFEEVLRGRHELVKVPRKWRRQVCVLKRGLRYPDAKKGFQISPARGGLSDQEMKVLGQQPSKRD
ncbi:MAG: PDZ domain-containing protein [Akkermansiaceae bacterium]